jgi:transcriptional regulator
MCQLARSATDGAELVYMPPQFIEDDVPTLHAAIRQARIASLVTSGPSGLVASHIPMLVDPGPGPFGTLRGHIARANPQWRDVTAGSQSLAIFLGPNSYVTPSYYETKRQTGKVVPTWNYVAIHAYGEVEFFDDTERLRAIVTELTTTHEGGRAAPWAVTDAPADYIAGMLRSIVGIQIPIARLEGKWKMSQNRPPVDRPGIIAGLADDGEAAVSEIVAERNRG